MKPTGFAPTLLAAALIAVGATAQTPAPAPAAKALAADKELAQARAELARAAKRVAELSGTMHATAPIARFEQQLIRRPVLGVLLAPDPEAGVRITGVTPDGAAAKAGVKSGDRLLSVDGTPLADADADLRVTKARKLLGSLDTGTPVKLGYARGGRNATLSVTPQVNERVFVWNGEAPRALEAPMFLGGDMQSLAGIDIETLRHDLPPGVAPQLRTEIIRLGADNLCKDKPCNLPMLVEAFRWNGLNLASVDAQLGRYFGTDRGVLVLSAGEDLSGLQPGDVIQRIDGKTVATPREAMDALRARPADSAVAVEYLRDRRSANAQVKVPKAMPLRIPVPPTPPAPPPPPAAARPPAPPPPVPAPVAQVERRVVIVDNNGTTRTWVDRGDDAQAPPPPAPPQAPMPPEPPVPPPALPAPEED